MQKSQSAISTFVQDIFSGIRVVKFFAREKYIEKNYGIKVTDYQNKALDLAKTEAYFFTIILFCHRIIKCCYYLDWRYKIYCRRIKHW